MRSEGMHPETPQSSAAMGEQRVSTLIGDRLCVRCGYNLTGQAILRELHYQMLIVRCPECATVASVQEYPLLGRWATRWGLVLAGLWVVVLLGFMVGTGATIFGFSISITEEACQPYSQFLSNQYSLHRKNAGNSPSWGIDEMREWHNQQDFSLLFQQAGGWRNAVEWDALWIGVPFAITVFAQGCFWSVAILGLRWRARLVVCALVMTVAAMFALLMFVQWHSEQMHVWFAGQRQIGSVFLLSGLVFGAIALAAGLTVGRSVVRGLVRVLLPPRLCQWLAILWTSDGLAPPRVMQRS